jgi:hypothetical protein
MVVACLALLVALTGTSVAAVSQFVPRNSVGTAQLKNNAVARTKLRNNAINSAKVANRSLLAVDFAQGQIPAGPPGAQGPAGPAGAQGPIGPSNAVFAQSGNNVLAWTGAVQVVQTLALPAGRWVVLSKALANSNDAANPSVDCTLVAGATVIDDGFDGARVGPAAGDDREYFTYFGAVELAAAGTVELRCTATGSGNFLSRRIVAIQVGAIG